MFQFRRFPTYTYLFSIRYVDIVHVGCPIRKSPDIAPVYGSPRLIAVSHVLLRLPVPRHSPCALLSLTFMWSSLFSTNMNSSIINYPISKHAWLFKTVVIHAYLSFVFSLFSFQGAFVRCQTLDIRYQILYLNPQTSNLKVNCLTLSFST